MGMESLSRVDSRGSAPRTSAACSSRYNNQVSIMHNVRFTHSSLFVLPSKNSFANAGNFCLRKNCK